MEASRCVKCGDVPEDILMLACSHDLCLPCAAERVAGKRRTRGITCQVCNMLTQLDDETIRQLQKIQTKKPTPRKPAVQTQDFKRKGYPALAGTLEQPSHASVYNPRASYHSALAAPAPAPAPAKPARTSLQCPQHEEQQLMYFCFDCKCNPICPECIIHGEHKNHDVKTIRKSFPVIRQELELDQKAMSEKVKLSTQSKLDFEKKCSSAYELATQTKNHIKTSFSKLRSRLDQKEKELIEGCDLALQSVTQSYRQSFELVQREVKLLESEIKTIDVKTKGDMVGLLEYYASAHEKLKDYSKRALPPFVGENPSKKLSGQEVNDSLDSLATSLDKLRFGDQAEWGKKVDQTKQRGFRNFR